jgi:hypothetical protein
VAEVASAYVSLIPSARGFGSKMDSQIGPGIAASGRKGGLSFGKLFVAGAAIAIGRKAFSFLGDSIAEGREAQKVGALTAQVLKTTGNAAGTSAKQVADLASAISLKTGIDDEAIQSGTNLLLTFKNVKNEVDGKFVGALNRATYAAADLSAAGFGSITSSSKMLGKALNDPVKGISALGRAGVTFSEQQKKVIEKLVETGDIAGAQGIILTELESQVGGAAAASATFGEKAKVAFGNIKEQIGTALLPLVDRFFKAFLNAMPTITRLIENIGPAISRFAGFIKTNFGPLAAAVVNFFRKGTESGDAFRAGVTTYIAIIRKYAEYIRGTVVPAFQAKLIPAIAKVREALAVLGQKIEANKPELQQLLDAFKRFANFIITQVAPKLVTLYGTHLSQVIKFVGNLIDVIGGAVRAFHSIKDAIGQASTAVGKFNEAVRDKITAAVNFIEGVPGKIKGAFSGAKTLLSSIGGQIIDGLVAGIQAAAGKVLAAADAIISKIPKVIRERMGIASPSKVTTLIGQQIMDGLSMGFDKGGKKVQERMKAQVEKIKETFATLKSDMASLSQSVASAFNPDFFGAGGTDAVTEDVDGVVKVLTPATSALEDFMAGLSGNSGNLTAMLAAFDQLKAAGASKDFLSGLFQSGNTALAQQLATAGPAAVQQASAIFDANASLANQLGNKVATDFHGAEIRDEMKSLNKAMDDAPKKYARELKDVLSGLELVVSGTEAGQRAYYRTGRRA